VDSIPSLEINLGQILPNSFYFALRYDTTMKKRVLIISPDIEYPHHRGIQKVLINMLQAFRSMDYEIFLLGGNVHLVSRRILKKETNETLQSLYFRHYVTDGLVDFYGKLRKYRVLRFGGLINGIRAILYVVFKKPLIFGIANSGKPKKQPILKGSDC